MGETIGSMSPKELRNLEGRLDRSVNRIRSKKVIVYDKYLQIQFII